jgi:hypothetical protein
VTRDETRAYNRRYWAMRQARAEIRREVLIRLLGGRCARCEAGPEEALLTVDHVGGGRTWNIRALNPVRRVDRYWEEVHAGVKLRVLCLECNTDDSNIRRLPEAPF